MMISSSDLKIIKYIGYGLAVPASATAKASNAGATAASLTEPAPPPPIQGMRLEKVSATEASPIEPTRPIAFVLLALSFLGGAWRQSRQEAETDIARA